ncbi:MAG: DUF421 domain-containing protein [Eubacteriaceae bacterium]
MLIIFIRVIIIYLMVFIVIRLMGKRQVGEMQPNELVITIMIAEIATAPLESIDIPLFNGLIPIFTILFLEAVITFLILKSNLARKIICGKPSIVLKGGILQEKEMKKLRISISDLNEQLRTKGYPKLHELEYIIFETNGQVSILTKDDKSLPITVIADGERVYKNLKQWNISEEWLDNEFKNQGITSDKDIFLAYVDNNKLFFHRKENNK